MFRSRPSKEVVTGAPAKSIELEAVITLGPESAAKYGVPVGTQVDLGTLAYWNRNPIRRFIGRLRRRRK